MDEATFGRVAEEASFEKNRGVLHSGEDAEAGAADATVRHVHACFFELHAGAPVDSGGEGNVGRVLPVTGF